MGLIIILEKSQIQILFYYLPYLLLLESYTYFFTILIIILYIYIYITIYNKRTILNLIKIKFINNNNLVGFAPN